VEDDVVVLVGGEDYLLHARVFYKINELYKKYNCLLTYGQFCTGKGFTNPSFDRRRFHKSFPGTELPISQKQLYFLYSSFIL